MKTLILILISLVSLSLAAQQQAVTSSDEALKQISQNLHLDEHLTLVKIELTQKDSSWSQNRDYVRITLKHPFAGDTSLLISGPKGFQTAAAMPALFLVGGYQVGSNSLQVIQPPENMILIGYDYPTNSSQIQKDPSQLLKTLRVIPGQLALAIQFLSQQKYIVADQLSIFGTSLGGLYIPSALRLAEQMGTKVTSKVFAFTGVDLAGMLELTFKDQLKKEVVDLIKSMTESLTELQDPQKYLPEITGKFLLIQADSDQIVSKESMFKLEQLLPAPKEVHTLQEKHIDINQLDLIQKSQGLVMNWLKK